MNLINIILLVVLSLTLHTPLALGKDDLVKYSVDDLNSIKEKIDSVKNKAGMEEAQRIRILNAYYAAEDNLEELLSFDKQIADIQQQLKMLPAENKRYEQQIAELEQQLRNNGRENYAIYPTDELEQRLIIERSNRNELNTNISRLETKLAELAKRPQKIREEIAQIKSTLSSTKDEIANLSSVITNKQESDARQLQLETRVRKLNVTISRLELENMVNPGLIETLKSELRLLSLQSDIISTLVKNIDTFLMERRQQDIVKAQDELMRAKKEAESKHPVIQKVAFKNIHYNTSLQEITLKLDLLSSRKQVIETLQKSLEKEFKSAEQKINLAGLSPALGNLLREQRRNLPLPAKFQDEFDQIQTDIATSGLEQFKLEEAQKALFDLDTAIQERMQPELIGAADELEKLKIRTELRMLLISQKDMVGKLIGLYSSFSRLLADNDFALHQLVQLGQKYSLYLDERLLWVPSAPIVDALYLIQIANSMLWYSDPYKWVQVGLDIQASIMANKSLALLGMVLIGALFWFRPKVKEGLQQMVKTSAMPYADKFSFTFTGLGYVLLLVLPMAMSIAWLGALLRFYDHADKFSHAVANGLLAASVPMVLIQFFYKLFRPDGLVHCLFSWQKHSIGLVHGQIKWVRLIVIPAVFVMGMFYDDKYSEHSHALGRLALLVGMSALTYMLHRLSHPKEGLAKDFYKNNPNSWSCRLRFIWYLIMVAVPLTIIGFAIAGYYQSALELQNKLIIILRLIFFTALFHEIVIRWFLLANRRMALENARNKRATKELAAQPNVSEIVNVKEDVLLDIPKINEQSLKILNALIVAILVSGLWLTLEDLFPAFSIFDQFVLWQSLEILDGQETVVPITLLNLSLCFLYLLLMLIFVNNFPGIVDLVFAGRYRIEAGTRYAMVQLMRYLVVTLTLITIANELGGSWSQVQWLVAALSVGLGFGLQEIFANLVSGIILLFERPVRVGDVVTIGNIDGKITKIHMRATTITDWDRKELIVPNKAFITEKLVNWTLDDTITRVVIPVGVSYSSDENLVKQMLNQIVGSHPKVLNDPAPQVFFVGFGDSSLNFSVRVFVRDLADRLPVTDDLHNTILQSFRQNNIEIPFPQRDLHIRSSAVNGASL
jgi:potassium-dependent mechanosensitive channel